MCAGCFANSHTRPAAHSPFSNPNSRRSSCGAVTSARLSPWGTRCFAQSSSCSSGASPIGTPPPTTKRFPCSARTALDQGADPVRVSLCGQRLSASNRNNHCMALSGQAGTRPGCRFFHAKARLFNVRPRLRHGFSRAALDERFPLANKNYYNLQQIPSHLSVHAGLRRSPLPRRSGAEPGPGVTQPTDRFGLRR